ncbi:MAG TPA: hypothetical protein VMV29_06825 [Ktedonobacterales bacterium]|nr:hypothetical protein [Ktedonobacterales bacterium]
MRRSIMNDMLLGVVAGATGTVALDTATYLDMALRGRASSATPANVAGVIADKLGAHTPAIIGQSSQAQSRRSGMGALLGYATGCSLGVAYGLAHPWLGRSTPLFSGFVLGALAMAASDTPAIALRQTNPRSWGVSGWLADIAPHLVYGYITAYTFEALWTQNANVASQKAQQALTQGRRQASRLAENISDVGGAVTTKRRALHWPAIFVAARNTQ